MGRHSRPRVGRHQFTPDTMRNKLFEEYYKQQGIVEADEWDAFMEALQKDLPITFRVTGFREQNRELLRLIKHRYANDINNMKFDTDSSASNDTAGENVGSLIGSFHQLSWYPNEMAWQLDASRYTVRKNKALKTLHQFLVSEMESGNISRQEAVSMLPPLLLDVHANHTVLDLCAAPGSKSAQLVELLHADAETACGEAGGAYVEPSGMVIANDVDQKRCYMMVHQVKRLQSPCTLVTQEDATCFPRLYLGSNKVHANELVFDRILADVPCSGDGTLRKNPDLWHRWTPNMGMAEHYLQLRILRRAAELLRNPGDTAAARLVYSTCSFNPLENEAVVASLLESSQGALQLVDLSRLPSFLNAPSAGFRVRPGLTTWRVMTNKAQWFDSFDEVPSNLRSNIRPSLFPPADVTALHLDRCIRVVPHDQNSGGFFMAVLEKVSPLPWMKSARQKPSTDHSCGDIEEKKADPVGNSDVSTPVEGSTKRQQGGDIEEKKADPVDNSDVSTPVEGSTKRQQADPPAIAMPVSKRPRRNQENPFTYVDPTSDLDWPKIRDYYGIVEVLEGGRSPGEMSTGGSVPFCPAQLLYRSGADEPRRRQFYYTNRMVKDVVVAMVSRGVRLVNTGVRMFSLMEDKQFTGYRLLQDGVELADAFLKVDGCRRIHLPGSLDGYADLVLLLKEEMPLISRMSSDTRKQWEDVEPGPVLIDFSPPVWDDLLASDESPDHMPRCRLVFAGWRGIKSLRHYVGRHERLHLMRLANLTPEPAIAGHTPMELHPKEVTGDGTAPQLPDEDGQDIPTSPSPRLELDKEVAS